MAMTQLYETKFIEQAMTSIGLCEHANALLGALDEMEFERKINERIEQIDNGEVEMIPIEDFMKKWDEKIAAGYYEKENIIKRMQDKAYTKGA